GPPSRATIAQRNPRSVGSLGVSGIFEEAVCDEATLRAGLAEANIPPSLMALVQLTGDMAILDEGAPYTRRPNTNLAHGCGRIPASPLVQEPSQSGDNC